MNSTATSRSRREAVLTPEITGVLMVLVSATGFGALPILAKFGYASGMVMEQMLAFRFLSAALAMTGLAIAAGHNPLGLGGRKLLSLLVMGCIGYAGQTLAFFAALRTLPASLTELVLYTFPAMVTLGNWLVYRRAIPLRHVAALVGSFIGVALLVGSVRVEITPDLAFAVAAPVVYALYIIVGERLMRDTPAAAASSVVMCGTALVWIVVAIAGRSFVPPSTPESLTVVAGLVIFSTLMAIPLFLAALPRIGSDRAALLSMWEPVVAVTLAFALLGESLTQVQIAGGVLLLVAVFSLQLRQTQGSAP